MSVREIIEQFKPIEVPLEISSQKAPDNISRSKSNSQRSNRSPSPIKPHIDSRSSSISSDIISNTRELLDIAKARKELQKTNEMHTYKRMVAREKTRQAK